MGNGGRTPYCGLTSAVGELNPGSYQPYGLYCQKGNMVCILPINCSYFTDKFINDTTRYNDVIIKQTKLFLYYSHDC